MSENVETWKPARLGLDGRGSPRVIQLVKKEGQKDSETLNRISQKFKNIEVKDVSKKKSKEKRNNVNRCYNRKWKVLEVIKKNEPTDFSTIKNNAYDSPHRGLKVILRRLAENNWIRRDENNIYDNGNINYVYSLGSEAQRFLKDKDADSFLWPDNPLDVGKNGERLE